MKIKRYEGPEMDLPKLMHQVKQDLGDNAIIKTQTFKKGGFLGVGGQRWVRILAGVEESSSHNGRDSSESRMHFDPPRKLTDQELKPERPITFNLDDSAAIKGILHELRTLKESINEIKSRDDEVKEQRKSVEADLPGWFEYLRKILIKSGMDREVARALSEGVIENTPLEDKDDFDRIKRHFIDYVVSMIVKPSDESLPGKVKAKERKVIILIGPTGVGKTTTLAKLAANYALLEDKSVCLITADTYRIAAIDQLRTFAQIINLPLDVVFSPFELKKAVESQKDKDVILVDTAGRSPLDEEKMTELAELLRQEIGAEVHLVLSATTKTGDLKAITEKFRSAGFDKLILSKIDETVTYGPLLEYLIEETPPLSYLTNGQNVPDDIIFAQERDLVELIAKRALEGGSQVV